MLEYTEIIGLPTLSIAMQNKDSYDSNRVVQVRRAGRAVIRERDYEDCRYIGVEQI